MVKILIVDDDKLDLFISKKLLNMEYTAEGFSTLPEVLSWAKENTFDIAIIDYYLVPPLLGDHVLKELRAIKGDAFKAYVLTNYVDQGQADKLISQGFSGVINKPLTLEGFKPLIN
jgi:CheY-like chemotaxis protein